MGSVITGSGIAVPPHLVTNHDLARIMDTSDDWIRSRTGVAQRRFVEPGVGSSDLAIQAGLAALADAGLDPGELDLVVTATMTPDVQAPGIVGKVQHGLGAGAVAGFDLRQQCSGFLYGLDLADAWLTSGRGKRAIVIGAEVHAGYLPWGETWPIVLGAPGEKADPEAYARNTAHRAWSVLFGDGAGAMVLEASDAPGGVLGSRLRTAGELSDLIRVPGVGFSRRPYIDAEQLDDDDHLPVMDGGGLYKNAVRLMPEVVLEVLEQCDLTASDVDLVVAHQANERILAGVRKQLGTDAATVPSNIAEWGNTTAGTLPILFHELRQEGRVEPGMLVCFVAFGAGAHWGAVLYRVPD
ncbi:MAG: 3-oxoacyl-ACP synthase [Acidimicrobiia bacterium]|nr:3-oxoacyl-ACP synthase [Acidimicrobiia bacterium]MDH4306172.1 3-oxoacyl-ACP synthase [Acidimicrobiia bacterium]MDH5292082.1 3-oxoacyl-ACP synthase [Acidimicrobiia bacterium]